MRVKYFFLKYFLIIIIIFIEKTLTQSVLFPHGYFDMKKLGAIDAFYLNMLALSNLEYGGTTIEELEALSKTRFPEETTDDHKDNNNEAFSHPNINTKENTEEEVIKNPFVLRIKKAFKAKRAAIENKLKYQLRGEQEEEENLKNNDNTSRENVKTNEIDDPFADIATRAPKRPWYQHKSRLLNRNGIMTRNRYQQLKSYYKQTTTTQKPINSDEIAKKIEEYHRPFIIALPIPPIFN